MDNIVKNPAIDTTKFLNLHNEVMEMEQRKLAMLREHVQYLKTLPQPAQLTPEWFAKRKTCFTASSDVASILGLKTKYPVKMEETILKKCGEGPVFNGNMFTRHGQKYEEIATQIYESRYQFHVYEYGLLPHPTITCLGASPDGIVEEIGRCLEIKVPMRRQITGVVPLGYWCQMQVQMSCCGLFECDFLECDIKEFKTYEDYLKDKYVPNNLKYLEINPRVEDRDFIKVPTDRRNALGLEKGIVAYYKVDGIFKYIHPPFDLDTSGQLKWLDNKRKEYSRQNKFLTYSYWTLKFSSCVLVKRDFKWGEDMKVEKTLYDTWAKVEYYRRNGTEELTAFKSKSKKQREDKPEAEKEHVSFGKLAIAFSDNESESSDGIKKIPKKRKLKKRKTPLIDPMEVEDNLVVTDFSFLCSDSEEEEKPVSKKKKVKKKLIRKVKKKRKIVKKKKTPMPTGFMFIDSD